MIEDRQFSVECNSELLPYLIGLPLGLSRKEAKDLLRFRAVHLRTNARVQHNTRLKAGDIVTITLRKRPGGTTLARHGLRIVYLDDAIAIVDKPAGLLSIGAEHEKERTAHRLLNEHLKALTKSKLQQAFIVHRLDRETSGLMIFARSMAIQGALQKNWKGVTKRYLAIVEGQPAEPSGTLENNLLESKSLRVYRVTHGGETAITHYRVVGRYRDKALLELTFETGRKHQIRVQLAIRGHPIVGDRKYGARINLAGRLALHSYELTLLHPASGALLRFHSALPARFQQLLESRGAAASSGPRPET